MATKEEMRLARQVLQLGMTITAQGKINMHVDYAAHVDVLSVWDDNGLAGWGCNDNQVYLGDFHDRFGKPTTEGIKQLEALIQKMDQLIDRDDDGVPL